MTISTLKNYSEIRRNFLKFLTLITLTVFIQPSSYGGSEILPTGSRQAGMGRISVAITDFWNCQNNQAGISLLDKTSVGLFYESRFALNQLSSKSAAVVVPTGIGVLGATFNYFGYNLYNEMKIGLIYARSFSPYFRIGVQLDYLQTSLGMDYGSKGNVTFEIGIQSDVTERLTLGAWVYNPIQVKLADYADERIPAIFRFGVAWHFSDHFFASVEAEKNTAFQPITIRGGLEYGINDKFFLRTGFSSQQEIFSMGFGFKIKILRFDISAIMHESLGFSPQASLIFEF